MQATARDSAKVDKKDTKESRDKPADDKTAAKQADDKQNDAKQNDKVAAAQSEPQSKPAAPAKAGKPEKNPDKDKSAVENETGETATDDKQVASVEQQISDQQMPAPVTQAPIAVISDTGTDTAEDIRIDVASPAPPAPSSGTELAQSDPLTTSAKAEADITAQALAAPQAPAQPSDGEADESKTAAASVVAQPIPGSPPVTVKDANKPSAVKTAAKSEAASTVKPQAANVEQAKVELTQPVKTSDEPVRSEEAKPAKTDLAKADGTDGVALKGTHNSVADNAKPAALDSQKTDALQGDVRPVEADNAAASAAPKPAPQSVSVSNAAFAINTIAVPQAAQHSQAPVATQHVQVTAQAQPNVPALAVEIAAKSQGGAKQFDIRLDPPELGRVEVRLSIDATGKASAHLSADQPQTLSLLQKDAPILTRALREAGLDVSQDGLNFSLRQQSNGQNGNDGNNGRFSGSRAFSLTATPSIDPAAAAFAYRGLADGRVDIRV